MFRAHCHVRTWTMAIDPHYTASSGNVSLWLAQSPMRNDDSMGSRLLHLPTEVRQVCSAYVGSLMMR